MACADSTVTYRYYLPAVAAFAAAMAEARDPTKELWVRKSPEGFIRLSVTRGEGLS